MNVFLGVPIRIFAVSFLLLMLLGATYYAGAGAWSCEDSCSCGSGKCCRKDANLCPNWSPCRCHTFDNFVEVVSEYCEETINTCDILDKALVSVARISARVAFVCFVYLLVAVPVWCCYRVVRSSLESVDINWQSSSEDDDIELEDKNIMCKMDSSDSQQA